MASGVSPFLLRARSFDWRWLAALPTLYYFGILGWYAYNMPYMDDYPVLVNFLNKLPAASPTETVRLLLEQNNFHRVVWVKLVAWLSYALTGQVSFTFLQILGNVALLLTGWLFWQSSKTLRSNDQKTNVSGDFLIFTIACLLFQFQSWNNTFWAMAAMSNLWAPAWALLAFWLTTRQREGWALLAGVVALLTNGNGILVLPLLLMGFLFRKNWRWATITGIILMPAFGLYFSGYSNPANVSLTTLLEPATLTHLLALDTAFLGAMFYHPSVSWLPIAVGGFSVVWTVFLLIQRYDQRNTTLFWMLVFLQLTGLMLAVNRVENPVEAVFASRYKNITALLVITVYLTVLDRLTQPALRRWFGGLALVGAVGICLVSNVTYFSKIVRFRELKQTDQLLWQPYGQIRGCNQQYQPAQQLRQLADAGIFQLKPLRISELQSRIINLPQPTGGSLTYRIDLQKTDGEFLIISGFAKIDGQKANFNDTFVGVRQASGQWVFWSTLFHQRLDNDDSLNDKDTGFTAIIPRSALSDPTQLGLLVRSGGKKAFQVCSL